MSYGLRVFNDNNKVIISDVTINPIYRGRATLASQMDPAYALGGSPDYDLEWQRFSYRLTFTFVCAENIIPFVSASDYVWFCLRSISRSDNTWTLCIHTNVPYASSGLQVLIFSPLPNGTQGGGGYGMVVRGADNAVKFSTNLNHLAPVHAVATATSEFAIDDYIGVGVPQSIYLYDPRRSMFANLPPYRILTPATYTYVPSVTGRPAMNLYYSRAASARWVWQYATEADVVEERFLYFTRYTPNGIEQYWFSDFIFEQNNDASQDSANEGTSGRQNNPQPKQYDYSLVIDTAHYG